MNKTLPFSKVTNEKVMGTIYELNIDSITRKYLINFLTEDDVIIENTRNSYINQSLFGFLNVVDGQNKSLKSFTWNTYCIQMHELNNVKTRCKDEKILGLPKKILSSFYKYMSENNSIVNAALADCIHLLLPYEFQLPKAMTGSRDIISNFNIGSNPKQILQFTFAYPNIKSVNVDIKANKDSFIYNMLQGFVEELIENEFVRSDRSSLRIFLYSFLNSIGEETYSINFFTFNLESFKRQMIYYEQIDIKYKFTSINTKRIIKNFYLYLDKVYSQEQGTRLFTSSIFNRDLISIDTFHIHILNDFVPCIHAPQEEMPQYDKWLLINDQDGCSPTYKDRLIRVDFTRVDKLFKAEFKEYLWERNVVNLNLDMEFTTIEKFLNSCLEYQKENNKIVFLNSTRNLFSTEFLLLYKTKIITRVLPNGKIVNNRTASAQLIRIRGYLNFIKEKYNIPDVNIQLLNSLKREHRGGKPLAEKELKEISNYILSDEDQENAKLYHYIFYLMCNTKLRLGEILNLERDCIVFKNEKMGFGELMYISKTSNGEKVKEVFLIEDIKIIENAIKFTNPLLKYVTEKYSKYIFITLDKRRLSPIVKNVGLRFIEYFNAVVKKLYKEGRIQKKYSANNLRHTYINMSWQAVEDNIISSMEVGFVTGNSAEVATKHYREYQTKRYLEAMHMVTIGNVGIDGEIQVAEEKLINLQQVKDGEGACKSSSCIKINNDDSDFECLTCRKFVTSIQRYELFQQRLAHYNQKAQTAEDGQERMYYKTLVELYARYLAEMYKIMETSE